MGFKLSNQFPYDEYNRIFWNEYSLSNTIPLTYQIQHMKGRVEMRMVLVSLEL